MLHKWWRYTYYYIIRGKVYLRNVNYVINNISILYKISFIDVKEDKAYQVDSENCSKYLTERTYDLCYDWSILLHRTDSTK